jgi:hypothetical protein
MWPLSKKQNRFVIFFFFALALYVLHFYLTLFFVEVLSAFPQLSVYLFVELYSFRFLYGSRHSPLVSTPPFFLYEKGRHGPC